MASGSPVSTTITERVEAKRGKPGRKIPARTSNFRAGQPGLSIISLAKRIHFSIGIIKVLL
jgi:hypothetical protein